MNLPAFSGLPAPLARSLVAASLASMVAAGPTHATNYFVTPGGADSNSGTSIADPWATIDKANTALGPGDVCYIAPGVYAHPISPVNNGTAGSAITYLGDLSDPNLIEVQGIELNRSFISVKGVSSSRGRGAAIAWLDASSRSARR